MARRNTLEGKRLRRIARRAHKERVAETFDKNLQAAFERKFPPG
jgi:hypothetical protein